MAAIHLGRSALTAIRPTRFSVKVRASEMAETRTAVLPAVIVGGGRVGRALLSAGVDGDVLVRRGEAVPADRDGPILVCTRNDDLESVLDATPRSRWSDLVFFQNGMLDPWLESKGLTDASQVLAYFAIAKLGERPIDGKTDTNPEGLTAASGKWAVAVASRLHAEGLSCKVLDKESFQKQMLEKLIWISAFMLVGARHPGATVGVVEKEYRTEVGQLIAELASAAASEKGLAFQEGMEDRLCAYSRTVSHFPTAVKEVECCLCRKKICTGGEVNCSVRDCRSSFHKKCAKILGFSRSSIFKCPHHVCFLCKQKPKWRCIRCTIAAHTKCCPWPDNISLLAGQPARAVCWRHHKDWHLANEYAAPTGDIEEAFQRLPLPYVNEEFSIDTLKDATKSENEPTPYVHIKRNIYLVKKKRDDGDIGGGCTNCDYRSTCGDDCECRSQSISCLKSCRCSSLCTNRPFRKEKKTKVVKTQLCGWGVEALEPIAKGDFIIEYIGEVIDDAQCEQRLWDVKRRGDTNFYMCEIRKDFTIDATFKGNVSRFLNHSCNPNCKLEKWQVEGETRVGVFASRAIAVGEPLTYDYRFEHFGPMVKCHCGAHNCQGYIGSKKKIKSLACWGCKRKRTSTGLRL